MRALCLALVALPLLCAPSTRVINDLNWMEFRELVPARIQTILIPPGTVIEKWNQAGIFERQKN